MKPPVQPSDEADRAEVLRSLDVLDTAPEERFDRLTRLARRVFGVPIALVSLIDADRQWFKSRVGLAVQETPREISFCGHAILQDDILIVPDTRADERFHDNPLVTGEPGMRFYAGRPLRVNGRPVGTLCIIDTQPRQLDDDDRAALHDLALMAEQELASLQLATVDHLTQLSNRRGFETLAHQALSACRRGGWAASLLFFDLDGFKQINDRFGHAEGDRALATFAELLRTAVRESDIVGRLGGDEFVGLLSQTSADESSGTITRLQQLVDARNLEDARGYALRYSVGIVDFAHDRHAGVGALIAEADVAMYANKQSAKGQ